MLKKYSDYAMVLNWEVLNDEPDIGKWELLSENEKKINGTGMSDLLEVLLQLNQEQINVIFVKELNLFEVIGECYFSYCSDFKAVVKNNQIMFFNLKLFDWVELINWDNYFKDIDDGKEFLRRLKICREHFNGRNKKKLSLKNHYRLTKAADQWFDIKQRYYLNKSWALQFKTDLLPQDQNELNLYLNVYKASFYFTNPKYINKTLTNVKGYDISSSHSGFILRKKYPYKSSQKCSSIEQVYNIIDEDWYAWIGEFEFVNLKQKFKLPIDLRQFGYLNDDDNWVLILTNAHWETFKRLFGAEDIIPYQFYYFEQKELDKNYAIMINDLYTEKEQFKHHEDKFLKSIFKFRTELPFGQSIKMPQTHVGVMYNEETNEFQKVKLAPETFEEIVNKLKQRALPFQIGVWTAAYSWAEEVDMILDLGIDNVVYGDTDCVKFIGDLEYIIEQHNKEIDRETNKISSKRNMLETSNKIGRWQFEGVFSKFKAIGVKWYLFKSEKGLEVKAAGADTKRLLSWLEEQKDPFQEFNKEMYVPNLFKNVCINRNKKTVSIQYNNYMGDKLIREMNLKTNGFYI